MIARLRYAAVAALGLAIGHSLEYGLLVDGPGTIPTHAFIEASVTAFLVALVALLISFGAWRRDGEGGSSFLLLAAIQASGFVLLEVSERALFGLTLADLPSTLGWGLVVQLLVALGLALLARGVERMFEGSRPEWSDGSEAPAAPLRSIAPSRRPLAAEPSAPRAPPLLV